MIVFQVEVDTQPVVLVGVEAWANRGVDPRAAAQQDPISTTFTPATVVEKGSTSWLLKGYRLTTHDAPGDTVLTYSLLLEVDGAGGVTGWWHEDHMEVPTSLWKVSGTLDQRALTLSLAGDEPKTVSGLLYRRPERKK